MNVATGGAGSAAVRSSALGEISSQMRDNLSLSQELGTQTERISDRAFGPCPPSPSTGQPDSDETGCAVDELRVLARQQHTALNQLQEQIQRLEAL